MLIIFLILFLTTIVGKIYIIEKYGKKNRDSFNHKAYVDSLSTNFIIQQSALAEENCYPPGLHYILRMFSSEKTMRYIPLVVDLLVTASVFLCCRQYVSLENAAALTFVRFLSTSLFFESTFISARLMGHLFFNFIIMATVLMNFGPLQLFIEVFCISMIFFFSPFAVQILVLVLLPAAAITGHVDLWLAFFAAFLLSALASKGFVIKVLKGNIMHNIWSFPNQIEYYIYKHYFREVKDELVHKKELDWAVTLKKLVVAPLREPYLLLLLGLTVYHSHIEYVFIVIVFFLYLLMAFSLRLERTIGESYRYFEYTIFPLTLLLLKDGFSRTQFFAQIVLGLFLLTSVFVFLKFKKQVSGTNNDLIDDVFLSEMINYLKTFPPKNVLTLPIHLSHYLALQTSHKFFYPYTYVGQYFLSRNGILPFFKFNDQNLITHKICDCVLMDNQYVDAFVEAALVQKYHLTLIQHTGHYKLFGKSHAD